MTLIEVMVAVAVSSVLMGVAMSLLLGLKKWDRNLREQSVRNEQTMRLADSIRSDLRRANDVTQPNDRTVAMRMEGQATIRYELTPEGCRRLADLVGEEGTRAELFNIKGLESWRVERRTDGGRPIVDLTLNRTSHTVDNVPAPLIVRAIISADTPRSLVPASQ